VRWGARRGGGRNSAREGGDSLGRGVCNRWSRQETSLLLEVIGPGRCQVTYLDQGPGQQGATGGHKGLTDVSAVGVKRKEGNGG